MANIYHGIYYGVIDMYGAEDSDNYCEFKTGEYSSLDDAKKAVSYLINDLELGNFPYSYEIRCIRDTNVLYGDYRNF